MIMVYGAFPTRSLRVMWALEELGKDYTLHPVDLRSRMADAEFLALNPSGFLPAMRDGDVTMVDSIAMLEYLIARYDSKGVLAPAASDACFPCYQQFLHIGESGLAAYLNVIVGSKFMAPENEKDNFGARMAQTMFEEPPCTGHAPTWPRADDGGRQFHRRRHLCGLCARHGGAPRPRRQVRAGDRGLSRPHGRAACLSARQRKMDACQSLDVILRHKAAPSRRSLCSLLTVTALPRRMI